MGHKSNAIMLHHQQNNSQYYNSAGILLIIGLIVSGIQPALIILTALAVFSAIHLRNRSLKKREELLASIALRSGQTTLEFETAAGKLLQLIAKAGKSHRKTDMGNMLVALDYLFIGLKVEQSTHAEMLAKSLIKMLTHQDYHADQYSYQIFEILLSALENPTPATEYEFGQLYKRFWLNIHYTFAVKVWQSEIPMHFKYCIRSLVYDVRQNPEADYSNHVRGYLSLLGRVYTSADLSRIWLQGLIQIERCLTNEDTRRMLYADFQVRMDQGFVLSDSSVRLMKMENWLTELDDLEDKPELDQLIRRYLGAKPKPEIAPEALALYEQDDELFN